MGTTKNIQSVERAFSILELFKDDNRQMSVKEISQALNLSKSTVFGLINTLNNLGYLSQSSETLRYSLGSNILLLGNSLSQNSVIVEKTTPLLQKLSDKFQETCLCAVEENGELTYMVKTESSSSITIRTRIGTKKPLYCTGIGKCYLAFMSPESCDAVLKSSLFKVTPHTITDPLAMLEELRQIRKNGYAIDNEEYEIGIKCVAVPVYNSKKQVISGICLTGPSFRFDEIDINIIVQALKETSANITESLKL